MRRSQRIRRFIVRGVATLAVGGFLGFLVPQVVADLSPQREVEFTAPESPVARRFINAFTADDQAVLAEMNIPVADRQRASRFRADFLRIDVPVHLGSYVSGGFTLHAYAAHAVMSDGTETTLAWRVATAGGQIFLIPPPTQIEAP